MKRRFGSLLLGGTLVFAACVGADEGDDPGTGRGGAPSGAAGHMTGESTTGTAGTRTSGGGGTTGEAGSPDGSRGGTGPGPGSAGASGTAGTAGSAGPDGSADGAEAGRGPGGVAGTGATAGSSEQGGAGQGIGNGGSRGGSTGAGGGTGNRQPICQFASGLNVAWVSFANDIPNPNINTFNVLFKNAYTAGGRVIRWWLHTNGTVTPGYNSDGTVKNIPQSHIDGVKAILNAAHANGVSLDISLWSFDMLQSNAGAAHAQNQQLLENDNIRQSYVTNYLTPLVTALRGTPGLYSYEIFNEPEGMGPKGWATYRTSEAAIQKCVNWFADAIHAADPTVRVTNGAVTFDYCSNVAGKNNYYSDAALRNVGGRQNGTLDFYEVHYYTSNGTSNSPFMNPASHWALDKKLVMGEFAAADTEGVGKDSLFTHLYDAGYNGAWAWSYDADWPWPAMKAGMQNVYDAHSSIVGACP